MLPGVGLTRGIEWETFRWRQYECRLCFRRKSDRCRMTSPQPPPFPRRHDLDALRAFAMLLGIALHASLAYIPVPWAVQDPNQNNIFLLFFVAVHGFRMPLFFLISGFFTAMLWQRRGIGSLLKQRFQRIAIPLLLATLTIGPAVHFASQWAITRGKTDPIATEYDPANDTLIAAVRRQDADAIREHLAAGADVNQTGAFPGVTPLCWAAMYGEVEIAKLLIDQGANANASNADGGRPLHGAALFGRADMVSLLVDNGADPTVRNDRNELPYKSTEFDVHMTQYFANMLRVPLGDDDSLRDGRRQCRELLPQSGPTIDNVSARMTYWQWINSDRLAIRWSNNGENLHLIQTPVFFHLWFLWFLCWYVPIFAAIFWLASRFQWTSPPGWLVLSPARFLWLLPLTMLPQYFMGIVIPVFGPDTSVGILPQPHVLLYYGLFFGFGALYFNYPDTDARVGRWWWVSLPLSLIVGIPLGLIFLGSYLIGGFIQVAFAWAVTFGCMGLCRKWLDSESKTLRYVSDSAYWLYLAHVPIVIALQAVVRSWPLPAIAKFTIVCVVTSAILLISYDLGVRYTWLGKLLNGPRERPKRE